MFDEFVEVRALDRQAQRVLIGIGRIGRDRELERVGVGDHESRTAPGLEGQPGHRLEEAQLEGLDEPVIEARVGGDQLLAQRGQAEDAAHRDLINQRLRD